MKQFTENKVCKAFVIVMLFVVSMNASALVCTQSTQESVVFDDPATPPDGTASFQYYVNNANVGQVDFYIHLSNPSGTVFSPSFKIILDDDPNVVDAASSSTMRSLSVPDEQFFGLDAVQLLQMKINDGTEPPPNMPNSYALTVDFSSYFHFGALDPSTGNCLIDDQPSYSKAVKVELSGLPPNVHLQVNAISRGCSGLTKVTETINPARAFNIESGPSCSDIQRPTDTVLLLDRSGSMRKNAEIIAWDVEPTRMSVLNDSVTAFFTVWNTPGQFLGEDQASLVHIDGPSDALNINGNFLIEFDNNADMTSLQNIASSQTPDGMTQIGDAVQIAFTGCADINQTTCVPHGRFDDSNNHYRHIVLFTDGGENPGVSPGVPINVPPEADGPLTLSGRDLRAYGVPIHTIGIGADNTTHQELLQKIALTTNGQHRFTTSPLTSTVGDFLHSLVEIFRTNTLGLNSELNGTMSNGGSAIDHGFQVNRTAKRLVFLLSWHSADPQDKLVMEVIPPGSSTPINTGTEILKKHLHTRSIILPLSEGPNAHEGEWTLRVKENINSSSMDYYAAVFVDEKALEYRAGVLPGNYGTGDRIKLQASVLEEGNPVGNADVKAYVTRPKTALGTMLSVHQISDEDLTTNPTGIPVDSFPSNYDRKLYHVVTNPQLQPLLEPIKDAVPVTLYDSGNVEHADAVQGDGIYSNIYDNTKIPGKYEFDITITGITPSTGQFTRSEKTSTLVSVNRPDKDESEISVSRIGNTSDYWIKAVPADKFGNFMGPGYAHKVAIAATGGGTITGNIIDKREDGTYQVNLAGVPANADPDITVHVSGTELFNCKLTECGSLKKRYAIFGSFGENSPQSNFDNFYDSDDSWRLGFERRFDSKKSLEVTYGHDSFVGINDLDVDRLSFDGKYYAILGTFQLGLYGGAGIYSADPGDTDLGINIGATGEYRITTKWSIEIDAGYHNVFTSGDDIRYTTLQGGVRYRY